jgi:FkbM family methyltransferase
MRLFRRQKQAPPEHWMWMPREAGARGRLEPFDLVFADKRTIVHRHMRTKGLRGWQAPTTSGLLAAWELANPTVFFDVGANAGLYSWLFKQHHPSSMAVAFEPFDKVRRAGRRTAEANGLEIRFEPHAVTDHNGEATLYVSAKTDATNSLEAGFREAKAEITVPAVTLDRYCQDTGLVPGVIKIDVEQHEPAVLRGAKDLLASRRPVVVVELLAHRDGELRPAGQQTSSMLRDLGYAGFRLVPPATSGDELGKFRDWIFWPDSVPSSFEGRYEAWWQAVDRCVPAKTPPSG